METMHLVSLAYAHYTIQLKAATHRADSGVTGEAITLCRELKTRGTANDNSRIYLCFANATTATAGASFSYDPYWPRRTAMVDQFGTTSWSYKALGSAGALQLDTENPPFTNDTLAYSYDALGRVSSRTIDVAVDSVTYDVLGRVNQHSVQDLGVFNYAYLGQTGAVTSRFKTVNNISTTWGYDSTINDRRLLNITNSNNARSYALTSNIYQLTGDTQTMPAGHPWLSQSFAYIYDKSDRLLSSTSGATVSYAYDKLDNATSFAGVTGTYDALNQISTFGGVTHTYDANGNLTNDGVRTYTYDAADRLIRINYVGNATKKSEFGYDGLGRRITQTETPTTGAAVTTRNLWCGSRLCQERTSADVVTARYYPEGERRPVAVEAYVYMPDSLGSVRELVDAATGTRVGALDYTPYGQVRDSYGVLPDYRYAELLWVGEVGLNASATRFYDGSTMRWMTRDWIREAGGINGYGYVGGNPLNGVDPSGLYCKSVWGVTKCVHPYGPSFEVPTLQGFSDVPADSVLHHTYAVSSPIGCVSPSDAFQGLVNRPTPGEPSCLVPAFDGAG